MPRSETTSPRARTNAAVADPDLKENFDEAAAESAGTSFVRKNRSAGPVATAERGWGAISKLRSAQQGDAWKPPYGDDKDEAVIKFLEADPAAVYDWHFLQKPVSSTKKRSFTCLGDECPLDDIGEKPKAQIVFNIAVNENGKWKSAHWIVSHRLSKVLEKLAKNAPLDAPERYFTVLKVGEQTATPSVTPVKERDLKDDWNVDPLTEDDLARVRKGMVDSSIVQYQTYEELATIADEILAQD